MAIVYSHTRLDNNTIFYIGIGNEYKRAYSKHSRNFYWNNIVSKTDYKVDILFENLTWDEACKKEVELISLYGRKDLKKGLLVNLTEGGDGVKGHSQETIDKITKAHKGRIQSEEEKSKRNNSRKGYFHSEETKKKIGNSNGIITLDSYTGVFFNSFREACESLNLKHKAEHARMKRGNNNRFILI